MNDQKARFVILFDTFPLKIVYFPPYREKKPIKPSQTTGEKKFQRGGGGDDLSRK